VNVSRNLSAGNLLTLSFPRNFSSTSPGFTAESDVKSSSKHSRGFPHGKAFSRFFPYRRENFPVFGSVHSCRFQVDCADTPLILRMLTNIAQYMYGENIVFLLFKIQSATSEYCNILCINLSIIVCSGDSGGKQARSDARPPCPKYGASAHWSL